MRRARPVEEEELNVSEAEALIGGWLLLAMIVLIVLLPIVRR